MLEKITVLKPGSYIGAVTLENGTKIYLAYSNDPGLRNIVCNQLENSTSNVYSLLRKIKNIKIKIEKKEISIVEEKQQLVEKYAKYFKNEQFEKVFDDFYKNQEKMEKILKVCEVAQMTFRGIFKEYLPTKELEIFTVCASVAPFNINDPNYPQLFSDRNIFMAMNCIMKIGEPDSISVSHYGILRDPCSLLGLTTPTNNSSMLLHSFAAYVSFQQYGKYLQVNGPMPDMLKIMEKSGIEIYSSTEELLSDGSLPEEITSYLKNKSISNLDHSKFAAMVKFIAIKLDNLAKKYENDFLLLDQSEILLFNDNRQSNPHQQISQNNPLFKPK